MKPHSEYSVACDTNNGYQRRKLPVRSCRNGKINAVMASGMSLFKKLHLWSGCFIPSLGVQRASDSGSRTVRF